MTTEKQQTPLQKLISKLKDSKNNGFDADDIALNTAIEWAESLLPEEKQIPPDAFDRVMAAFVTAELQDEQWHDEDTARLILENLTNKTYGTNKTE